MTYIPTVSKSNQMHCQLRTLLCFILMGFEWYVDEKIPAENGQR